MLLRMIHIVSGNIYHRGRDNNKTVIYYIKIK